MATTVVLLKTFHRALKETHAMTAPNSVDPARFLHDQLASASLDLLRSMLTTFVNTLMMSGVYLVSAETITNGPPGEGCEHRTTTAPPVGAARFERL